MNGSGYIKLWRDIKSHWIWQDAEHLRAWLDLLMRASHHVTKVVKGGKLVPVVRGQVFTSQMALAAAWGWDRKTVRGFLELLKADDMVDFTTNTSGATGHTLVTICNYGKWQGNDKSETDTPADTHAPLDGHSRPTFKKGKKSKNENLAPKTNAKTTTTPCAPSAPGLEGLTLEAHRSSNGNTSAPAGSPEHDEAAGALAGDPPAWGTPDALVVLYNATAPDGLPRVQKLSDGRRKKAKEYLEQFPTREFWSEAFAEIGRSAFLTGCHRSEGHLRFKADFDWLLTKGKDGVENIVKVAEGKYRDTSPPAAAAIAEPYADRYPDWEAEDKKLEALRPRFDAAWVEGNSAAAKARTELAARKAARPESTTWAALSAKEKIG